MFMRSAFVPYILGTFVLLGTALFAYAQTAPLITNVKTAVTETTATIEWDTDVNSDSSIQYGLTRNAGSDRDYDLTRKHKLTVDDLDPGTKYYFYVNSADDSGNQTSSGSFVFTTKSLPDQKSTRLESALAAVRQLETDEELIQVSKEVLERLENVSSPPSIIGEPRVIAGAESAEISWVTDRDSNSLVMFVEERNYRSNTSDPYNLEQGDSRTYGLTHKVRLIGLKPATLYHYKVVSEDVAGLAGESVDYTFRTKSDLPEIKNLRVTKVQETAATVSWSTEVPASGIVEFTNTRTKKARSAGSPTFATSQTIVLTELEFGARYTAIVRAVNKAGDEVTSKSFDFTTVPDREPPVISKVTNESTIFPGGENKIQTIVSWETDEASVCEFRYHQGLVPKSEEDTESLGLETNPVTSHVKVIVGLTPATVYRFWMECLDNAENRARSEDFVLYTPTQEKSIIDIILENFEGTFGWVKNIGG